MIISVMPTAAVTRESTGAAKVVVPRKVVGSTLGMAVTPGRVKVTMGGTAMQAA